MSRSRNLSWLKTWEALLVFLLAVVILLNIQLSPFYLGIGNIVNLFQLSIEKIIIALVMTFIIINGEIDLSVASVMGLSASLLAYLHATGFPLELSILITLATGAFCGAFNGFWVAFGGLPSLAVTLAGLVGFRGLARVLIEDRSIGGFPAWFNFLGQKPLIGPFPAALLLFFLLFILAAVVLHYSAFGRYVYIIGNNKDAARYSGVKVRYIKMMLFVFSGLVSAFAGILLAARLGAVRASTGDGFELDIITMVLLGGVSIFGGKGTLVGVGLSILLILNLRNGMGLANISGNAQTMVIGILLILSVLIPNLAQEAQNLWKRRAASARPLIDRSSQEVIT